MQKDERRTLALLPRDLKHIAEACEECDERLNGPVLKAGDGSHPSVGSNPTSSA